MKPIILYTNFKKPVICMKSEGGIRSSGTVITDSVSDYVGAGNRTWFLYKISSALNH